LRRSEIGNPDFVRAISDTKIAKATDEDIKQVLRYAMLLVGIRSQNMPTDEEKAVLLAFIRRTYQGHTPAEIRLAFDKAVAGELDLTTDDVKPYENFSCEYVSRIMRAYRSWASAQYRIRQETETQTDVKAIETKQSSPIDFVDYFFDSYLSGTLGLEIFPEVAYDRAKSLFKIEYSEGELKAFVLRARDTVLASLTDQIRETDSNKRLGEYTALKQEFDLLRRTDPLDSCNVPSVNRLAKLYALETFFAAQKAKGITSLRSL
jgi:hypothetical protein